MEQNHDPHQIVISREYFDKLVHAAKQSNIMEPSEVHPNRTLASAVYWHARKYNPAYKEEQRIARIENEAKKKVRRQKVIDFLRQWRGRDIAIDTGFGSRLNIQNARVLGLYEGNKNRVLFRLINKEGKESYYFSPFHLPTTVFYEIKRITNTPEQELP